MSASAAPALTAASRPSANCRSRRARNPDAPSRRQQDTAGRAAAAIPRRRPASGGVPSKRRPAPATTARAPSPTSSARRRRAPGCRPAAPRARGAQAAGGRLGQPADDEPRERRRQRRRGTASAMRSRPASAVSTTTSSTSASSRSSCGGAHDVGRRARVDGLQRGQQPVAHAPARVRVGRVGRVVAPRQAARAAPGAGLLARDRRAAGARGGPSAAACPSSARRPGDAASR